MSMTLTSFRRALGSLTKHGDKTRLEVKPEDAVLIGGNFLGDVKSFDDFIAAGGDRTVGTVFRAFFEWF